MAFLSSSSSCPASQRLFSLCFSCSKSQQWVPVVLSCRFSPNFFASVPSLFFVTTTGHGHKQYHRRSRLCASRLCTKQTVEIPGLLVSETVSEDQLWAAACLRVQSFYEFNPSFGIEDHKRYLSEHEFEALKGRISGKTIGFKRVSCINATLPLLQMSSSSDDLCSKCKGIGADLARAYLSNVCVAKELHRNGVGYALVAKSKKVAQEWGITDLYVHVVVGNEAAMNLYMNSGFIYENDEPVWQARFLGRPCRILLWADLACK